MKCVIIAAGISSRITEETNGTPKTLLPFREGTILSTIINNFSQCGITDFVIVVGCEAEKIIDYVQENKHFNYNITFVTNHDWKRGNGLSVLAAENTVKNDNFLLSMSDHILPVNSINRLINYDSPKNLLLVDQRIDKIFDIDDATKVMVEQNRIVRIGKELDNYHGIDCGVFRLTKRYFDSMREQSKIGNESISAAINGFIKNDDMQAVFFEDDEQWIDIDTPSAYRHALKYLNE